MDERPFADQPVPVIVGPHGLTGRVEVVRVPEVEDYAAEAPQPIRGKVIPSNCRRCQQTGRTCHDPQGMGFVGPCPGQQRDGSCLLDVVRAAQAAGVEWEFELKYEGDEVWWDYVGAPIPGR